MGTEYIKASKLEPAEAEFQQELEIDPNNILARYKLGMLEAQRGEGAKSKELIEGALRQNPAIKDSSYYLGRAEMELGNNAAAADAFNRAISAPDSDREIVQQAWYQLGVVYRRLHRIDEAQKAFTTFQRLKDEEAQKFQEPLKKKREASRQGAAPPPPSEKPL
jgi:tetratricopeptide (TPR) repeat protein